MLDVFFSILTSGFLVLLTSWGIFFLGGKREKGKKISELQRQAKKDFIDIYSEFIALRYMNNIMYIKDSDKRLKPINNYLKKTDLIIQNYEKACLLHAKYESLKPLFISLYPKTTEDINFLHAKFHNWRRLIREDKPILQDFNGKSTPELKDLKFRYKRVLSKTIN